MTAPALVRSTLYALLQLAFTPIWAFVVLASFPLPPLARYRVIRVWSRVMLWGSQAICGIRYRVLGAENIPLEPCIILSKHESAWETIAFQFIFPPQVWVVKRELLWIPFFGWGLALGSPIAIDRGARKRALLQVIAQGRQRLGMGFFIVIFPEGTRTRPGVRGVYRSGGARLAIETGAPVLPVAHNAGTYWGRNAFVKRPGTITVSIGPAVRAKSRSAVELMQNIEQWIENETQRIRSHEAR